VIGWQSRQGPFQHYFHQKQTQLSNNNRQIILCAAAMAPIDDDIGFMGPILGRAKKVLFPDGDDNAVDAQKSATTVNKKKKATSRARRAGGSSLANVTVHNNNNDGKENNGSQSSLNVSKNNKRCSAYQKMDSLAVTSTIHQEAASKSTESITKSDYQPKQSRGKASTGGRRSEGSRSILDSCLLVSYEPQQNVYIRKAAGGRRSGGIQTCSLLTSSETEQQQNNHDRRKPRVQFHSTLLPGNEVIDIDTNQQQQNRRRGRSNHLMSSLVQSDCSTDNTKAKSKRGSYSGGISSRSSAGASSLMALPSSTQKKSKSPQRQQKKKSTRTKPKGEANISSLTNEVGRLSLDSEEKMCLSPTFRSPLSSRHRSMRPSGVITSPEGMLRFSTMTNTNMFPQHALMECSPISSLNPRKRLDKKKTPPKIIGLSSSESPSVLEPLPDKSSSEELVESTSLPEISTITEMNIDAKPSVGDAAQTAIITEAESYVGRRMARTFDNQVYHGTVTKFIKTHRLWKISYDDGDKEEMDFEELSYAMDLYDGRIEESDYAENRQNEENHKPGSAVIDVEAAPPIAKPPKAKRTYSKLPKKQLQTTNESKEEVSNQIVTVATKEDFEPTRKSTRAAKPTDRLTVSSWKNKSRFNKNANCAVDGTDEASSDSPSVSNDHLIENDDNKPKQSQQQDLDTDPIKHDGIWSNDEVSALRGAIKEMNPTSSTYWDDVSSAVGTKSPYDCRQKWFSLVATPKVKRATSKKENKTQLNAIDCKHTGKESIAVQYDDDLFDATPFRQESVENRDDDNSKRSIFDQAKFSFGLSPCVLQQRIAKSEQNDVVSDVKSRRKGYNTYIEHLRKDLNKKSQKTKPNEPILMNKKLATDSRIFVEKSEQNKVSGQLLPDGTVQIIMQEESFEEEEIDDMWADYCDEE